MRITYDEYVDAMFVYLVPNIGFGEAKVGRTCMAMPEVTLVLDDNGKLLGIEMLYASKVLPPQGLEWVRETAELLGPPGIYRPKELMEDEQIGGVGPPSSEESVDE